MKPFSVLLIALSFCTTPAIAQWRPAAGSSVVIAPPVYPQSASSTNGNSETPTVTSRFSAFGIGQAAAAPPTSIHPAVVRIIAPGRDGVSYGSGTLVAKNEQHGLVITNWHVINELAGQLTVVFADGFQSPGTIVKTDQDWDLAAIAIWRPNAEPVRLSTTAPAPGEMLSIAGYGTGQYRAAKGACTQYLAPGERFPFEMVELATTARQGDSGGPIFNERGELAGVLFGEGDGRTAGSYCGRVQWFLSNLVPQHELGTAGTMVAQNNPRAPHTVAHTMPTSKTPAPPRLVPVGPGARVSSLAALNDSQAEPTAQPMAPRIVPIAETTRLAAAPADETWQDSQSPLPTIVAEDPELDTRDIRTMPTPLNEHNAETAVVESELDNNGFDWMQLAGKTRGEQIKTGLASVGTLAILFRLRKLFGKAPAEEPKKKKKRRRDDDDDEDDD